jgi:glycosyltransferase involved in cell wall biosynthesis
MGRAVARQIALDHATGKYLAYLDADDFYHHEKLQKQVNFLEKNTDIALVGTHLITYNSSFIPEAKRGTYLQSPVKYSFGDKIYLSMATAMVKLEIAKKIKYNPILNASEDRDFFSKYLNGREYMNLNEILFFYSVTESTTYKKILEYTWYEILRGFTVLPKRITSGLRIVIIHFLKLTVYAITIPFLGRDYYLKKRGQIIEQNDKDLFNSQLSKVFNLEKNEALDL